MPTGRTLAVALTGLLAHGASGLYADEVGKLDWHQQNLGRFASAAFDGGGRLTVVGEASTLASVDPNTGDLKWRQVLSPKDTILATSAPNAEASSTATVSGDGHVVRLWSLDNGSLTWETLLRAEAAGAGVPTVVSDEAESVEEEGAFLTAGVVLMPQGYVVVLSAGGIHVLSLVSGAVLAQWWCDPAREPDLAALVGSEVQVTFTSLRLTPGGGGSLLAGGWSSKKGSEGQAEAFVVAEINPAERLVTFKTAKTSDLGVDPSAGVTVALAHGGGVGSGGSSAKDQLAVVGVCKDGESLAIFAPASSDSSSSAVAAPLPAGVADGDDSVSGLADLVGTSGGVIELQRANGGPVAVTLSAGVGSGAVSVVEGVQGAKEAWSCPGDDAGGEACTLAGGVSPSGKTFVASATMKKGDEESNASARKLVVNVVEVTAWGDYMASPASTFESGALSSVGQDSAGFIQSAFLEAGEGNACAHKGSKACFRVLVVGEDDSATMVGESRLEWVREEALAGVDQAVFVDSSKDDLAMLAAAGKEVEHDVPSLQERLQMHYLELKTYIESSIQTVTGIRLPGSELLDEGYAAHSAFGLGKLAICTTKVGKIFALDMADGTMAWSISRPSWTPKDAKVLLFATRPKGALGYSPEVVIIAIGEASTIVSSRDALTGVETSREKFDMKVASAVPMGVTDSQERAVIMLVDSEKRVHSVPGSAEAANALRGMVPHLFYHNVSEDGLDSYAVMEGSSSDGDDGAAMGSTLVASMPFNPKRSKVVATAYPDRRDGVPTPAHTLGDDSLLIKYINPRLFAFATLSPEEKGSEKAGGDAAALNDKGQELTVTLVDYVSGRVLHRISHKGAAEPVHMQVSESWVVYSYWSAVSHRTEMSTLSLYEGMIDKYGLSPFNRPEWKEEFSSFESRVPIVLQKTFVFPLPVTALGITLTQHGITSKNILVGTAVGQVVSLDRRFLDPRRPQEEPSKTEKEEKLLQYNPFLPVVPTQVLSYYKVIERVNRVLTEPTGLESTSLVLALGLDIFGSRVAPSKTYDMLSPNFNYALLVLVLVGMTGAVLVANRFSANKRLKEQWA